LPEIVWVNVPGLLPVLVQEGFFNDGEDRSMPPLLHVTEILSPAAWMLLITGAAGI
jgi:hypothetical protein